MKKLILTALLFAATFSAAYAQVGSNVDQTFNVTANVLSTLAITNTNALEFDDVVQGDNKTVGANTTTGSVETNYGTGQLADFAIVGTSNKEVGAYVATSNNLTDASSNSLLLEDWVAWGSSSSTLSGAGTKANPTSWGNHIAVTLDGSGTGKVWFGATVKPTSSQNPGTYSTTNTITFYYTGN